MEEVTTVVIPQSDYARKNVHHKAVWWKPEFTVHHIVDYLKSAPRGTFIIRRAPDGHKHHYDDLHLAIASGRYDENKKSEAMYHVMLRSHTRDEKSYWKVGNSWFEDITDLVRYSCKNAFEFPDKTQNVALNLGDMKTVEVAHKTLGRDRGKAAKARKAIHLQVMELDSKIKSAEADVANRETERQRRAREFEEKAQAMSTEQAMRERRKHDKEAEKEAAAAKKRQEKLDVEKKKRDTVEASRAKAEEKRLQDIAAEEAKIEAIERSLRKLGSRPSVVQQDEDMPVLKKAPERKESQKPAINTHVVGDRDFVEVGSKAKIEQVVPEWTNSKLTNMQRVK